MQRVWQKFENTRLPVRWSGIWNGSCGVPCNRIVTKDRSSGIDLICSGGSLDENTHAILPRESINFPYALIQPSDWFVSIPSRKRKLIVKDDIFTIRTIKIRMEDNKDLKYRLTSILKAWTNFLLTIRRVFPLINFFFHVVNSRAISYLSWKKYIQFWNIYCNIDPLQRYIHQDPLNYLLLTDTSTLPI